MNFFFRADELERLEEEAKLSVRQQTEGDNGEEKQGKEGERENSNEIMSGIFGLIVSRMAHRLDDLRMKRTDLEAQRASVVNQIHELQTQITARRKEGKNN